MTTVEDLLRDLARAGEPSVAAPPYLAEKALRRRRRPRLVVGALAVVAVGGVVGLRGTGDSRYFSQVVPSSAMLPTVQVGGSVVADRHLRAQDQDVVVARIDADGDTITVVKRLMAVAGETLGCPAGPDGRCHAWVRNGTPLDESYVTPDDSPVPTTTVPAGQVYLLGDDRPNSSDSRNLGTFPASAITGVAVQVVDPQGHAHAVPGAPAHHGPTGNVDPEQPAPPAGAHPVGSP